MQTISGMVQRRYSKQKTLVVILTNNASLGRENDLEAGIRTFLRTLPSDLERSIQIRFLCSITTTLHISNSYFEDSSTIAMVRRLLYPCSNLTLRFFCNIGIHYEEELRSLFEAFSRTIFASMPLPKIGMSRLANLELELSSLTLSSEDSIHEGLKRICLYCLASSDQVNPLVLMGRGLMAKPSSALSQGPSRVSNDATFWALSNYLASNQMMLVVRAGYNGGFQYYGLVPPPLHFEGHMALVQLATREDILRSEEEAFVPSKVAADEVTAYPYAFIPHAESIP